MIEDKWAMSLRVYFNDILWLGFETAASNVDNIFILSLSHMDADMVLATNSLVVGL